MMSTNVLRLTDRGLYCPAGDFYIDPWLPVARAVITHAHGDHLARGCGAYLGSRPGAGLLSARLGPEAVIETIPYGETIAIHGARVSLHPAGHILGSAQVRVEHQGQVAVVSGDYKVIPDPTTTPFEPLACDVFVTEATFGLPIYRWPEPERVLGEINTWWKANQAAGKASVVYAYALGKAQRVLAGLDESIGPIFTHGMVERLNAVYRAGGVRLPPTTLATQGGRKDFPQALILAPVSARGTPWINRFGAHASAFVSGWMRIRGARRQRHVDRGFVLSDHADWPGLNQAVRATGASQIWVTHGYTVELSRWLSEQGLNAVPLQTRYEGERVEEELEPLPVEGNEEPLSQSNEEG